MATSCNSSSFPSNCGHCKFSKNAPPRTLSVLLVVPPYSGHVIPFLALAEELAQLRHHNVTLLTGASDFVRREAERLNVTLWSVGKESVLTPHEFTEQARAVVGKGIWEHADMLSELIMRFQTGAFRLMDSQSVRSFDIIAGDAAYTLFLRCFSRKWKIPSVNIWPLLTSAYDLCPWALPFQMFGYSDDLSFFQRFVSVVAHKFLLLILQINFSGTFAIF